MGSNVCGNCGNFKPEPGEKFLNCTGARHAGLSYGMQVRADTRACEAFVPFEASATPALVQPKEQLPRKEPLEPVGLCTVGKRTLVTVVAVSILLDSWLLYTCARL